MINIFKKLISLIIIGIVWFYPATFPEIRAQQVIVQGAKAGAYSGASIEQLESRKIAIESMAGIDAKVKTDAIDYIERAITFVGLYESIGSKANELSKLISIAPKRVKELQAELLQTFTKEDKAQSPYQQQGAPDLEQQIRQSEADLAEKLMLKAAKNNPLVLKSPPARAVFLGFGDNTLNFEVRIYVKTFDDYIPMLHQMNRTIDHSFRENGVTIAFPQRDVHLDTTGPLDIRLVSPDASVPVKGE